MLVTKLFMGHFEGEYGSAKRKFIDIDTEINNLICNSDIELIDIKYAVSVLDGEMWNSALMIYKIK